MIVLPGGSPKLFLSIPKIHTTMREDSFGYWGGNIDADTYSGLDDPAPDLRASVIK